MPAYPSSGGSRVSTPGGTPLGTPSGTQGNTPGSGAKCVVASSGATPAASPPFSPYTVEPLVAAAGAPDQRAAGAPDQRADQRADAAALSRKVQATLDAVEATLAHTLAQAARGESGRKSTTAADGCGGHVTDERSRRRPRVPDTLNDAPKDGRGHEAAERVPPAPAPPRAHAPMRQPPRAWQATHRAYATGARPTQTAHADVGRHRIELGGAGAKGAQAQPLVGADLDDRGVMRLLHERIRACRAHLDNLSS